MKNRFEEINHFLHYFGALYLTNPDLVISGDTFYDALSNYGLTSEEIADKRKSKINHKIKDVFFNRWINYFANNPNLDVFYTLMQGRFLQFHNLKTDTSECYKLYVSFPEDKMEECVKLIFKFIADNNMETVSKVADCIRSDSVVLRMVKKDDAKKVIEYINNNKFISSSCKPTNPFLQKSGNVGLAYDRWLSYNSMLSMMLQRYFVQKRVNNNLDDVSAEDFREYVEEIYRTIFSDRDSLNNFINEKNVIQLISSYDGRMTREEVLSNIKDVLDLMILELDPTKEVGHYFQKVDTYMNPNHNRKNCSLISHLLSKKTNVNEKEIVDNYIIYATKKYGSVDKAFKYLNSYLNTGDVNAITRDSISLYADGFRTLFSKYITCDLLFDIVGGNLKEYMETLVKGDISKEDNISIDKMTIFENACNATLEKYGIYQLINALNFGMLGNYMYFTNGGNNEYRDKLIKYVDVDSFKQFATKLLATIDKHENAIKEHSQNIEYVSDKVEKKHVLIPVLIEGNNKSINIVNLSMNLKGFTYEGNEQKVPLSKEMARSFDESYSDYSRNKSFENYSENEDVEWPSYASFAAVKLPDRIVLDIKKQLEKVNTYDELKEIETESTIYSFVPSASSIVMSVDFNSGSKLDIVVDEKSLVLSPEKILQRFLDYSLPCGKVSINYHDRMIEKWIGYTKTEEIIILKKKIRQMESIIKLFDNNHSVNQFGNSHNR